MRFVIVALAVYRLAHLIALDDGPGDLLIRLRTAVAGRYGLESWQARGVCCPVCVSFWLVWPAALLLQPESLLEFAVLALALSAPAAVIARWTA